MKKIVLSLIFVALISVATSYAGNYGFGISGSGGGTKVEYPGLDTTDDSYTIGLYGVIKIAGGLQIEPGFYVGATTQKDPNNIDADIENDRTQSTFGVNVSVFATPVQNGPVSVLIGGDIAFVSWGSPSDATTYKSEQGTFMVSVPLAVELALNEIVSVRLSQSVANAYTQVYASTPNTGSVYKRARTGFSFANSWAPEFSINFTF